MELELKQKWTTALRSGKYEQGRGRLRSKNNSFCCMGVLCDQLDPTKWELGQYDGRYYYGDKLRTGTLGDDLRDTIGMPWKLETTLVHMNDSGRDFAEIADFIEKCLG